MKLDGLFFIYYERPHGPGGRLIDGATGEVIPEDPFYGVIETFAATTPSDRIQRAIDELPEDVKPDSLITGNGEDYDELVGRRPVCMFHEGMGVPSYLFGYSPPERYAYEAAHRAAVPACNAALTPCLWPAYQAGEAAVNAYRRKQAD